MTICQKPVADYMEMARAFHGHLAPGTLCGGFMVDLATRHLPEDRLYDVISETSACLPDAIQLLTPCTTGNGWMQIVDSGRFAMVFYDKKTGDGVRVALDLSRLSHFPEFEIWALKKKPKKKQDKKRLFDEIRKAGTSVYKVEKVTVDLSRVAGKKTGIRICPICKESFRANTDGICPGCLGEVPFTLPAAPPETATLPVEAAVGKTVSHDLTRIIQGKEKGAAFRAGDVVKKADIAPLKAMGKNRIHINLEAPEGHIHENEAADALADLLCGEGLKKGGAPVEGRIDLVAKSDGVFIHDPESLSSMNRIPGILVAAKKRWHPARRGESVAATRAIPLHLPEAALLAVKKTHKTPPMRLAPYKLRKVGILVTGNEVVEGRIEDRFCHRISTTCSRLGAGVIATRIVPDDRDAIKHAASDLLLAGAEILVATGGMSVDADDVTRFGLQDAGMTDSHYGCPVLPGAMTLTGRIGNTRVIGVPAGALFYDDSAFDRLLPLLMADLPVTREILSDMAAGGLLSPNPLPGAENIVCSCRRKVVETGNGN